jgi:hypothetical protein
MVLCALWPLLQDRLRGSAQLRAARLERGYGDWAATWRATVAARACAPRRATRNMISSPVDMVNIGWRFGAHRNTSLTSSSSPRHVAKRVRTLTSCPTPPRSSSIALGPLASEKRCSCVASGSPRTAAEVPPATAASRQVRFWMRLADAGTQSALH